MEKPRAREVVMETSGVKVPEAWLTMVVPDSSLALTCPEAAEAFGVERVLCRLQGICEMASVPRQLL